MFHCNGWCFTWAVTAVGAQARLPAEGRSAGRLAADRRRAGHPPERRADRPRDARRRRGGARRSTRPVQVTTAGAPPPPDRDLPHRGARLPDQPRLRPDRDLRADHGLRVARRLGRSGRRGARATKARQGVAFVTSDPVRVVDESMSDVPRDGETMGEVVMRGNNVMKGYFADEAATAEAFRGGWFHSGDLARHAPGRLHRGSRPCQGHHHLGR